MTLFPQSTTLGVSILSTIVMFMVPVSVGIFVVQLFVQKLEKEQANARRTDEENGPEEEDDTTDDE